MSAPIGTVGQLVAVIRGQLTARIDVNAPKQRPSSTGRTTSVRTYSPENLEALIGQRIKSIGRDDPQRGRKAFRVFLESILLSHFGDHLINDPKFYQLIDDVQMSMEADSEIRNLVASAIQHLLSSAP
jgi:hypothetical protein